MSHSIVITVIVNQNVVMDEKITKNTVTDEKNGKFWKSNQKIAMDKELV